MKQSLLVILTLILMSALSFLGFQCGSAESTSAKLYIQRGDLVSAEKALEKEVQKNPNNAEAWYLLGDIRRQTGNIKGMVNAYDSSLRINKEWEQKIVESKKYVWGQNINLGVTRFNTSRTAATKGEPKDSVERLTHLAINAYNDALLVNADSAITYQNLAIAYMALGNTDEEIKYLKMSLERKHDTQFSTYLINAYVMKAEEAKKAGNKTDTEMYFNLAITTLTDARKADPENQEYLSTLINVYIEAGRPTDAMPYIKEAVDKDPSNKVFQNDLGLLLMQTNDLKGSIEHFDAAIATDSTFTDALRNGSIAYMKRGQKEKEEAMLKADPKTGNKDKTYQATFNTAAKLLEKYLSIKPDDAPVWQALATAYGGADNTKKAMEAIKKADSLEKK